MTTNTAPRAVRIFGREPAALLGLIEAAIALFVILVGRELGLDGGFTVALMALVSVGVGAYSAWATKDDLLGYAIGGAKAIFGLTLYFGFEVAVETQAAFTAFIAAAFGFWQRTQTSPVAAPVDPSPTQVTESPVPVQPDGEHRDLDGDGVADGYGARYGD